LAPDEGERILQYIRLCVAAACAVVVVGALPAVAGAGPPTTCAANGGVSTPARAEGATELVGDAVLNCTGGTATPSANPVPTFTITAVLSAPLTSRVLASPWGEPLLLVDEPAAGSQLACQTLNGECTLTGNGTGAGQYNGSFGHPNIFQGQISGNTVTFANIPIDSAGANSRVLRITNLRADVTGIPTGGGGVPGSVAATIGINGSSAPSVNNGTPTLAFVQQGLTFAALTPNGSAPLPGATDVPACGSQAVGTLRYTENFATALKKRTVASDPTITGPQNSLTVGTYNTESGFFNPVLVGNAARGNLGAAGLADFGTRIKAVFDHLPDGASLFVPTTLASAKGQAKLQLVTSETAPYSAVAPSGSGPAGTAPVAASGGRAVAVWQVTDASPNDFETLTVPVTAASGAGAGTVTVAGGLGPGGSSGSIPRFADPAGSVDLARIAACPGGASGAAAVVRRLSLSPKSFRAASSGASVSAVRRRRPPIGTKVTLLLTGRAAAKLTVERAAAGRRSGRRCGKPTLRNRRARKCTRYLKLRGSITRRAGAKSTFRFRGRIGGRRLAVGRYRLVAVVGKTAPKRASFTIVR
jgi:hypothetical protein